MYQSQYQALFVMSCPSNEKTQFITHLDLYLPMIQENQSRIRQQLSLNLFGGFRQQSLRNKEPASLKEKKRAIRQQEPTVERPNQRVNEMQDGISETVKRGNNRRRQTKIVQQIMNVSMNIARELNFEEKYQLQETLGEGAHAIVKKAFTRKGEKVAIKICRSGDPEIVKTFIDTYRICRILNHQSILKCQEIYVDEETEQLQLVMEYCEFPSIEKVLKQQKEHTLSEETVRNLMKSIFEAVVHMHERGVAHRDLKPDNILMDPTSDGLCIRIIDFGVSAKFKTYESSHAQLHIVSKDMWTRTGNYLYCAPEIFEGGGYNEEIDIWACGIIMYQCLFGTLPFHEDSIFSTITQIRDSQLTIPEQGITPIAKDLLQRLLQSNPARRVTAEGACQHPWFYRTCRINSQSKILLQSDKSLQHHDDRDSPRKQMPHFDRNKFARSNTILNIRMQPKSDDEETKKPFDCESPFKQEQLKLILEGNFEDSDSEGMSPVMRISKLNQQIDKEIHIRKKQNHVFGTDFLRSRLVINIQKMQEDEVISEVFSSVDGIQHPDVVNEQKEDVCQ